MDLQNTFYLLGTVLFTISIVVFVVAVMVIAVLYYRYKKFLKESKQKVAQFKRKVSALPFLPIIGLFFRKLRERKRAD